MRLPGEIVERIASYIQHADDFFNLLDTLSDALDPGSSFEKLWRLSTTDGMHREDLWPTLHVRQLRDPATADAIRAVVDLFPLVHIHKMTDLALVRRCT
ncbi:hypothetical protein As57867_002646, partial [Aphanomyces stellatus]